MDVEALVVNLGHKCATVKEDTLKASKVASLENENNLIKEYLEEERHLKDGAISKSQFSMEKASKYSGELVKSGEAEKRSLKSHFREKGIDFSQGE